jgi:hypothetical protein
MKRSSGKLELLRLEVLRLEVKYGSTQDKKRFGKFTKKKKRKNLSSTSTSQILADSLLDFINDFVNMLPNDRVTEDTSNLISNLSFDNSACLWKGIYYNYRVLS